MTDSVAADGQTAMTGNLNLNSNKIVNLATPTLSTDAVTKAYADALVGGAGSFTTLTSSGATTFTAGTASTSTTTGTAVITGGLGVSGRINAANFDGIVGANTAAAGSFTTLSATGVTTVQAGTAALPAITTSGDTNTGIFFPAADTIAFTEGGTEAMRINSSSGVQVLNCLGVGNATPSTSGAGITFPATQSASSDANTLDDYEEGTWTATVSAGSIASQNCTYTKIGRAVFLCGEITYGVGTTTEDPSFSGLPFTSANTNEPAVAIYSQNMEVSSGGPIIGFVLKNNTQISFYSFVNNGLGTARQSAGNISFHAVYFI
jgi:hypothetical protein